MGKTRAYYQHELSGFIASAAEEGYDVDNLLIFLEGSLWKGLGNGDHTITFDAGDGNTIAADYVGVANHNLSGAAFKLQYSDGALIGSELVINGNFTSDAADWAADASNLASIGGGQSGNALEVENSGAASGSAYQGIAVAIGETYKISVYFKKGTGATGAIKIGTTTDNDFYESDLGLTDAAWTQYTYYFTAIESTVRITFVNESIVATETSLFDTATMKILSWSDAVSFSPSNNFPFLKEFTSQDERFWRIQLTSLTSTPFIGIAYWGELVEWDFPSLFDPDAEEDQATINESETGYLLGINIKFTRGTIDIKFKGVLDQSVLWLNLKSWWDSHRMRLLFITWDIENHPDDIYFVRPENKFRGPFISAVYREVSLKFTGRVSK
jgi:hypothetical protein